MSNIQDQLKTIREALEQAKQNTTHGQIAWNCKEALTALTQLEAMVGEQEPCGWYDEGRVFLHEKKLPPNGADLYAAPVTQQPTFDARRALEAIEALLSNIRRDAPSLSGKVMGFAEEVAAALRDKVAQQPQAEAPLRCPDSIDGRHDFGPDGGRCAGETCTAVKPFEAPQQAEAVPPIYYMRDNHTFKRLSDNVERALIEVEQEFNSGWTHGTLCSKRKGFDPVHASGSDSRLQFFAKCKDALDAAAPQQAEAVPWARDDLDGMVEALRRVIEVHYNTKNPFHNPVYADARMAHRILVGYLPYMKHAAIAQQKGSQ